MSNFNNILLEQLKSQNELCKKCITQDRMLCSGMKFKLNKEEGNLVPSYEPCRKLQEKTFLEAYKSRCLKSGIPMSIIDSHEDSELLDQDFFEKSNQIAFDYSLDMLKKIQSYLLYKIRQNVDCMLLMAPLLETTKADYNQCVIEPDILVVVRYDLIRNTNVKAELVFNLTQRVDLDKPTILLDRLMNLSGDQNDNDYEDIRRFFE